MTRHRPLPSHHVFDRLSTYHASHRPLPVAVCHPCSEVALRAALEAAEHGLIAPILVGPIAQMRSCAAAAGLDLGPYALLDVRDDVEAAVKAVELCRLGKAQALMKGSLHTDVLMREVVRRDGGLETSRGDVKKRKFLYAKPVGLRAKLNGHNPKRSFGKCLRDSPNTRSIASTSCCPGISNRRRPLRSLATTQRRR